MKILILPSWYPNNDQDTNGVFFRDQALALARAGHDVSVLAIKLRSLRTLFNADAEYKIYENDEGVPTYRKQLWAALPRIPYGNYFLVKLTTIRLFKHFVKQHGLPDIIHAHSLIYAGVVAAELGKKHNIPVVLTEHSSGFARELYKPWQMRLAKKAVHNGIAILIAVSASFAKLLECQLEKSWIYIPNIVAERFSFNAVSNYKLKNIVPIIMNLSLMSPNKGHKNLLEAVSFLKENGFEAELWLAGDGPIRAELEHYTAELGVSNQVKFLGMICPVNVPVLMSKIDLLVVSSEYETFGVVAAEALMLGKPVVATKCGGPESILEEGDGLLVPVKEPMALADAIRKVLENMSAFESKQISKRAYERFGSNAVAEQLTEIYKELLNSWPSHG